MASNKEGQEDILKIQHGAKFMPAILSHPYPPTVSDTAVVLTHGAGGDMNSPQLVSLAKHLTHAGYWVLRFTCKGLNLAYRTKVFISVVNHIYREKKPIINNFLIGGSSMGSRAAIDAAIEIMETPDHPLQDLLRGVVCLSYPLHKVGDVSTLRDAPLKKITYPVLFISGTNDEMAEKELLDNAMMLIPAKNSVKCVWIEGGNHGYKVKSRSPEEVAAEVNEAVLDFCEDYCKDIVSNGQ